MPDGATAAFAPLSPALRLDRVAAVINSASGGVGAGAEARLRSVASHHGLEIKVASVSPDGVAQALKEAIAAGPDLLVLLAGDGTASAAAELCGMDGPLLAPLPGGTMNMLPHALYGRLTWPDALSAALAAGVERSVSGGEIAGRPFYVAAILGEPAMLADAREAARRGKFGLALRRAHRAWSRAFAGRLRFSLAGEPRRKAGALSLMCPLVSAGMTEDKALEAAVLDPRGAGDVFRLGLSTLVGRWRSDPAVCVETCTHGQAWARGRIPVLLDGELHRLDSPVDIHFRPRAFRALALAPPPPAAMTIAPP